MEILHSKKLTKNDISGKSAQEFVDIAEIKDDVVILKNGTLRAVLMVSSINFDLKSTHEQEAIVAAYQEFLNSLDFPIQIVVSSRKLDINPYLEMLSEKEKEAAERTAALSDHRIPRFHEKSHGRREYHGENILHRYSFCAHGRKKRKFY